MAPILHDLHQHSAFARAANRPPRIRPRIRRSSKEVIVDDIIELLNSYRGRNYTDMMVHSLQAELVDVLRNALNKSKISDFKIINLYSDWMIINIFTYGKLRSFSLTFDRYNASINFTEK